MTLFQPTKRVYLGGWEIRFSRSHPPRPWLPKFRRGGTVLADAFQFYWLTVYVWGSKWH